MDISDFKKPTQYPFGMLQGYSNAGNKEKTLAYILARCIEVGDFVAVKTIDSHPSMVTDGLLDEVGDHQYKLTKKAIGLLYSQYFSE